MDATAQTPTAAKPVVVCGVAFHSKSLGDGRFLWRSADGRFAVMRNFNSSTYRAEIDGVAIKGKLHRDKRFRSMEAAMAAAATLVTGVHRRDSVVHLRSKRETVLGVGTVCMMSPRTALVRMTDVVEAVTCKECQRLIKGEPKTRRAPLRKGAN